MHWSHEPIVRTANRWCVDFNLLHMVRTLQGTDQALEGRVGAPVTLLDPSGALNDDVGHSRLDCLVCTLGIPTPRLGPSSPPLGVGRTVFHTRRAGHEQVHFESTQDTSGGFPMVLEPFGIRERPAKVSAAVGVRFGVAH